MEFSLLFLLWWKHAFFSSLELFFYSRRLFIHEMFWRGKNKIFFPLILFSQVIAFGHSLLPKNFQSKWVIHNLKFIYSFTSESREPKQVLIFLFFYIRETRHVGEKWDESKFFIFQGSFYAFKKIFIWFFLANLALFSLNNSLIFKSMAN
jgi:hypothetical protein